MRLDTSERLPRLFFTEVGMAELRAMVMDRRLMDPAKFAHVRQELVPFVIDSAAGVRIDGPATAESIRGQERDRG
jgi:hypothetical protein